MKAESNTQPTLFLIEADGTVLLRENIVEIVKTDANGIQLVGYQYDEYRLNVTYRDNLSQKINNNFADWLAYAKGEISKADLAVTNKTDITARLKEAIDDNKAYLALTAPTSAQTTAQAKKLSRQINRIIRYQLNQFDGAD
jgi:hypothetical protein